MSFLVEIKCPFAWKLCSADDGMNEFPLNNIAYTLLEETGHHGIARENDFDSEIQRLEHKINLVIQMLGQMMQSKQSRPDKVLLRLGAETIDWQNPQAQPGERYLVSLYLYESVAVPIQAYVDIIEKQGEWCSARIVPLSTDEQSAWERWVFRQHRRQVANTRAHTSSPR